MKEILVIRRRYLGDLVLMTPVFRNLKVHEPRSRITLVVDEQYRDALSVHPDIDEIRGLPLRRRGEGRLAFFGRWLAFVRGLRRRKFDVVYDLTQNDRSALVSIVSGARRRVSFVNGRKRLRHHFFSPRVEWTAQDRSELHSVELHLKVIEADGVPIATTRVRLPVPEEERRKARELIAEAMRVGGGAGRRGGPLLLVHPGARTESKRWPAERMAGVCELARKELGARVLLLAGPGEDEVLRRVGRRPDGSTHPILGASLSVPELAGVLAEGDLFLCYDSGPMHLAAAVGTPVVALFGAADPVRWAPRGEGHRVVRPSMPCPCVHPERCRPPDPYKMWCVHRIEEGDVLEALEASLAEAESA